MYVYRHIVNEGLYVSTNIYMHIYKYICIHVPTHKWWCPNDISYKLKVLMIITFSGILWVDGLKLYNVTIKLQWEERKQMALITPNF